MECDILKLGKIIEQLRAIRQKMKELDDKPLHCECKRCEKGVEPYETD